ncbi:hypothetical protein [Shewanella algae]|uniref:hypothetical protein n=1 Tax=Shewanella algae TaxID=38313 RepID=UPI00313C9676
MAFLLRKISPNKWQPNLALEPKNYSADAITGCTRTQHNTLSVWHSDTNDFSNRSVEELVVALATTMQQPDKIDVIWLDENDLTQLGLNIDDNSATTKFESVNSRHKDIVELDHEKLALVSEHIVNQFKNSNNRKSYGRAELIKLISEWSDNPDTFALESLSDKWIAAVEKYRERQ